MHAKDSPPGTWVPAGPLTLACTVTSRMHASFRVLRSWAPTGPGQQAGCERLQASYKLTRRAQAAVRAFEGVDRKRRGASTCTNSCTQCLWRPSLTARARQEEEAARAHAICHLCCDMSLGAFCLSNWVRSSAGRGGHGPRSAQVRVWSLQSRSPRAWTQSFASRSTWMFLRTHVRARPDR